MCCGGNGWCLDVACLACVVRLSLASHAVVHRLPQRRLSTTTTTLLLPLVASTSSLTTTGSADDPTGSGTKRQGDARPEQHQRDGSWGRLPVAAAPPGPLRWCQAGAGGDECTGSSRGQASPDHDQRRAPCRKGQTLLWPHVWFSASPPPSSLWNGACLLGLGDLTTPGVYGESWDGTSMRGGGGGACGCARTRTPSAIRLRWQVGRWTP